MALLIKETNELSLTASEEMEMQTRLKSFRKYFDANKPLKNFDADVFESIVEKIILGGIDDKGKKDPHQLTFVFKTGPKSSITMGKEPYSHLSPDTCGSNCFTTKQIYVEIVDFTTFVELWTADRKEGKPRNKRLIDHIKVSAGVYLDVKGTIDE